MSPSLNTNVVLRIFLFFQVERAAEACAGAMAGVLPADVVIRVLNPIIKTGDFPVNQAAIKMLTKLADHEPASEVIAQHLAEIMPGLLKVRFKSDLVCLKIFYS